MVSERQSGLWPQALNSLAFYLGWFACVVGAARGYPWLGPVAVPLLLTLQAPVVPAVMRRWRFLLAVGLLGASLDTGLALSGVMVFSQDWLPSWFCPPWLFALWILFASTLVGALRFLTERQGLASLLGAVGGPLSYWAGAALGALQLGGDTRLGEVPWGSLAVLAVVWGAVLPGLFRLGAVMEKTGSLTG